MRARIFLAAMLAVAGCAGEAAACSCGRAANAGEAMRQANTVFWGRVTAIETRNNRKLMRVQAWTGKGWVPVTIRTGLLSASCGVVLPRGTVMLIGAGRSDEGLSTNLCLMLAITEFKHEIAAILEGCEPFGACP